METVIASVKKTGKVIVLHEDVEIGGIGAELVTQINEACFEYLDAPIRRVASLNTPIPFEDRKSTRLNSSHVRISYAVFCLKKKKHRIRLAHICALQQQRIATLPSPRIDRLHPRLPLLAQVRSHSLRHSLLKVTIPAVIAHH